jgi:type IV secretion system protein VirB11
MNTDPQIFEKLNHIFGNLIMNALNDPFVIEVMLNADGRLWADTFDGMKEIGAFDNNTARTIICTVASITDTLVQRENPDLSGEIPFQMNGNVTLLRFQGMIPPIVMKPIFSIRKPASRVFPLDEYLRQGIINEIQRDYIRSAIMDHKNILVVGGTGSGKTTFLNALLKEITEQFTNERIGIIEDTYELQCSASNKFELHTSETRDMNSLLRDCMRLRPDRIIVGEVRGKEANSLLKAWNTGHPGGLGTVHANDALSGLRRMEQLIQEANLTPIPEIIAETVNVVIFITKAKENKAGRIVKEILEVCGYDRAGRGYITTRIVDDDALYEFETGDKLLEIMEETIISHDHR